MVSWGILRPLALGGDYFMPQGALVYTSVMLVVSPGGERTGELCCVHT